MANLKSHEAIVAELRRTLEELEGLVAEHRERLVQAEAALEAERARLPALGDFARSTLTNFYGRVTKVTPRADGRAWVEINPYLTPTLPGRSTLDLFDAWELIDDPAEATEGAGDDATGIEIVAQLTETLAMFAPSRAMGMARPDTAGTLPPALSPPLAPPLAPDLAPPLAPALPPAPQPRSATRSRKAASDAGKAPPPAASGAEPAHGPN
jgi:hypothetical protein